MQVWAGVAGLRFIWVAEHKKLVSRKQFTEPKTGINTTTKKHLKILKYSYWKCILSFWLVIFWCEAGYNFTLICAVNTGFLRFSAKRPPCLIFVTFWVKETYLLTHRWWFTFFFHKCLWIFVLTTVKNARAMNINRSSASVTVKSKPAITSTQNTKSLLS